jgi:hypothetical protein
MTTNLNRAVVFALAMLCVAGGSVATSSATPLRSDDFGYTTPGTLSGNVNPGSGTAWDFFGTGTGGSLSLAAQDVPYPAYTGWTAAVNNTSAHPTGATYSGNGYDRLQIGSAISSGSVFYSLTLRVTDIQGANFRDNTAGSFLAALRNDSTFTTTASSSRDPALAARLSIRAATPGIGTGGPNSGMATGFVLGIQNTQSGSDTSSRAFDSEVFQQGDTIFVVVEHVFNAGASDDEVRLYINPPVGLPGAPDATSTSATTDLANIQGFVLRSNSTLPASAIVDNLRVGTTWADVAPVPEPGSIAALGLLGAGLLARRRHTNG